MFFQLLELNSVPFLCGILIALGLSLDIHISACLFVLYFVLEACVQLHGLPFYSKKWLLFLSLIFLSFCYKACFFKKASNGSGAGVVKIEQLQPFKDHYFYKGELVKWIDSKNIQAKKSPIIFFHPKKIECSVILCTGNIHDNHLSIKRWAPCSNQEVGLRFLLKKRALDRLQALFSNIDVAHFFSALFLGWNLNPQLKNAFLQCGQSHLLAISGLHFALFALLVSLFLKRLPHYLYLGLILIILTLYYLFLGPSPSVTRAYVMLLFYFSMQLFDRQTLALDALGLALIFELLWHPFSIESVGFQLSYGTTFFLVQYYRPLKEKLSLALRLCSRYELNSYSTRDLFGLYLLVALQKLFILNVCTCLFSYPLILFHFHELSLSYLIYNFFFPFFALISILFGLFTFVTTLFAPISQWLTLQILDLLVFVPEGFNIKLNLRTMPLVLLYLYYPLLFLVMQKDYRLQPIFRACRFKFSLLVQRGYLLFKK